MGLARFRVRSDLREPKTFACDRNGSLGKAVTALQSLAFEGGLRFHSLDDNVFFEPRGFWVRAGAKAHFALEGRRDVDVVLSLANGGRENWVEVEQTEKVLQFSLRPFETKRVQVSFENDLAYHDGDLGCRLSSCRARSSQGRPPPIGCLLDRPRL